MGTAHSRFVLMLNTMSLFGVYFLGVMCLFRCLFFVAEFCVFISAGTLFYAVFTVNHLTPTGKNGSLCQKIITQTKTIIQLQHVTLPTCHFHVVLFRLFLFSQTALNFQLWLKVLKKTNKCAVHRKMGNRN